ncbi:MAG: Kazal domain-containing protein [Rhizobiales bacterium]|nr:Kazal domain-containing protein [Hyphomicrobiales bacterium]
MTSCLHRVTAMLIFALALLLAPAGASAKVGDSCGGFIGNVLCGHGEFCQHAAGQCTSMLPGACAAVPFACPRNYKPVCGCNGKTYANDCVRMQAKVSKRHDGKCTNP